jgi:malonyl-CoA decarboxylase
VFENFNKDRLLHQARETAKRLISEHGESNAQSIAIKLADLYRQLDLRQRHEFFNYLASEFNPDPSEVKAIADAYAREPSASNLIALCRQTEPRRQELLRRLNRAPGGTKVIVQMRQELLPLLKDHDPWRVIDADMYHLLSSWFNPGFLELHRITWESPAELLEKIIQHESVHAIDGWDDLRRRLQPDRRCFAFFHRQLPKEPLIFLEVALVPSISRDVGALINKSSPVAESKTFKTAIFYSISNCQPGLRGVSLGNFLIKRVAEKLAEEIPSLKVYSTLSPIPGLTRWLDAGAPLENPEVTESLRRRMDESIRVLGLPGKTWAERVKAGWRPDQSADKEKQALLSLCAAYLMFYTTSQRGDNVANFHLSNGATLHQLNWAADLSNKGLQQSAGLMVNYLYELDKVEEQHEAFSRGQVIRSRNVEKLI